jgi:predicted amino acid-binding ACT domain protein
MKTNRVPVDIGLTARPACVLSLRKVLTKDKPCAEKVCHGCFAGTDSHRGRQARAGRFAVDGGSRSWRQLASAGLHVVVEASAQHPVALSRTLHLELLGDDHPGIVRDISRVLAAREINVDELSTELTSAPMSGDRLFKATLRLQVPADGSVEDLRETLEALANDLMVDITLDKSADSAA